MHTHLTFDNINDDDWQRRLTNGLTPLNDPLWIRPKVDVNVTSQLTWRTHRYDNDWLTSPLTIPRGPDLWWSWWELSALSLYT